MDISSKDSVESSKEDDVTDASLARELLHEGFPIRAGRNVKAAVGDAFTALRRRERELRRDEKWTERRVRAIWNSEARRIEHCEIEDLRAVARREVTLEYQRSKARQARLAALLADPLAPRGGALSDLARERVGGVDSPGAEFGPAEYDADAVQTEGWGQG